MNIDNCELMFKFNDRARKLLWEMTDPIIEEHLYNYSIRKVFNALHMLKLHVAEADVNAHTFNDICADTDTAMRVATDMFAETALSGNSTAWEWAAACNSSYHDVDDTIRITRKSDGSQTNVLEREHVTRESVQKYASSRGTLVAEVVDELLTAIDDAYVNYHITHNTPMHEFTPYANHLVVYGKLHGRNYSICHYALAVNIADQTSKITEVHIGCALSNDRHAFELREIAQNRASFLQSHKVICNCGRALNGDIVEFTPMEYADLEKLLLEYIANYIPINLSPKGLNAVHKTFAHTFNYINSPEISYDRCSIQLAWTDF